MRAEEATVDEVGAGGDTEDYRRLDTTEDRRAP